MLCLENRCPKCKGNLIVEVEDLSLQCEDCDYYEKAKNKKTFLALEEVAVEYGPKEKRRKPSKLGKLFLKPNEGLGSYLKATLREAVRGLDMEDYDLEELNKYGFLEKEETDGQKID